MNTICPKAADRIHAWNPTYWDGSRYCDACLLVEQETPRPPQKAANEKSDAEERVEEIREALANPISDAEIASMQRRVGWASARSFENRDVRRLIHRVLEYRPELITASATIAKVCRERDEARDQAAESMAERDAAVAVGTQLERERDEARAGLEPLREAHAKLLEQRDEARRDRDFFDSERIKLAEENERLHAVITAARVAARCHEGKGYTEADYKKAPPGSSLGDVQVLRDALALFDAKKEGGL